MENRIDPICAMQGTIPAYNHWFCSQHCVQEYEKRQAGVSAQLSVDTQGKKRIAYMLIVVIVIGGAVSWQYGVMQEFMGWFFVVVAILKFLDLSGFSKAYAKYDLIAMRLPMRGTLYPFIELVVGICFIIGFQIQLIAWVTLILMIIGTIGVTKKLLKNEQFQCACLGTKLNVPLTNLTVVEDVLMGVMALMLLVG